jgi:CHASE2 domain-containing sensor protein
MVATWLAQGAHVPTGAVGPMALGTLSVSTYALLAAMLFPLMPVALAALICWIAAICVASIPAYIFLRSRHRQHARLQEPRAHHA